jgi:uncharacterized protein
MKKITKSLLMLLFTLVGVVSVQAQEVPEQEDWFKSINFCFRDQASNVEAYKVRTEAVWSVDPDDETEGCIEVQVAPNSTPWTCQFWIRGAEYVDAPIVDDKAVLNEKFGVGGFSGANGFKVTMRVKASGNYSVDTQAHKAFQYGNNGNFGKLNVTTEWQTVSFCLSR